MRQASENTTAAYLLYRSSSADASFATSRRASRRSSCAGNDGSEHVGEDGKGTPADLQGGCQGIARSDLLMLSVDEQVPQILRNAKSPPGIGRADRHRAAM